MDKVKLTREQAEMIKNHKEADNLEMLLRKHRMLGCLTYIDELTTQQVVDAYFDGYKVDPDFEVGDWVVYDNGVRCGYKTNQIKDVDEQKAYFDEGRTMLLTRLRHATPEEIAEEKQRRWWAKHGRDVFEFKTGDLIVHGEVVLEVSEVRDDLLWGEMNAAAGTITKENYDQIKVICFAEDRKDLEA